MNVTANRLFAISLAVVVTAASIAAEPWTPPRTPHGQPDMQGVWFYGSSTTFERPEALGNQKSYTAAEAEQVMQSLIAADTEKSQPLSADRDAPEPGARIAQEADDNFSTMRTNLTKIDGQYRTSQVVKPENGRLPRKESGMDIFQKWLAAGHGQFDGPEIRPASERCVGPNGGPMAPLIGWFYNANMQIVQTSDYVMILAEMNHDARIISLSDESRDSGFAQWMGNSVGYWEGETLVVNTANFRPEQSWFAFPMSDQLRVTERFTLIDDNEIFYSYTFTDTELFTEPVTVEKNITRRAAGEQVFEYACHEGNYSTPSILAGARVQERGK